MSMIRLLPLGAALFAAAAYALSRSACGQRPPSLKGRQTEEYICEA